MAPTYRNSHLFVDGPVVHHFDDFQWGAWRPGRTWLKEQPTDICKSMSPVDTCRYGTAGGAAGTPGYLSLAVEKADQFYAESAPVWWIPGRLFDLRNTYATFYLKEIEPIGVAPGYEPHLFIAAYMPRGHMPRLRLSGWYLKEPLKVGKGEWAYNEVFLSTDPDKWFNYHTLNPTEDTLEEVLTYCGFIGWWYYNGPSYTGVDATGTMGWDEVRYNLKESDLADLRAGRPLTNELEM